MNVLSIKFGQMGCARKLHESRLDPHDTAQDCLLFLIRKTESRKLRIDSAVRNESERPIVLLRLLYVSIARFVFSAISEGRRTNGEVAASDYFHAADSGGLEACSKSDDAAGAVALIRDMDEAEDCVIGDIVTRTKEETDAVSQIWLCLSDKFVTTGHLLTYHEMPESLRRRKEVSVELHALILSRFNRYLAQVASV